VMLVIRNLPEPPQHELDSCIMLYQFHRARLFDTY
jgi:hypothetical protein